MKNYPQVVTKVFREPWLIHPDQHAAIVKLVETRLVGDVSVNMMGSETAEPAEMAMDGGIAVIPVHGIIGKHLSMLETLCGGCDLDTVGNMIDAAEGDTNVKEILIDFRTPGGTATGVPEMGRKIAKLSKRTTSFTDSQCCSGGLWLASQCTEFYCTESSRVGSVGCLIKVLDLSRAYQAEGINVQAIHAGKFKLLGADWKPLTPEETAMLQARVDKLHDEFKDAVTSRRQIEDQYLQGQDFSGQEAVEIGMASGLVESISELLS